MTTRQLDSEEAFSAPGVKDVQRPGGEALEGVHGALEAKAAFGLEVSERVVKKRSESLPAGSTHAAIVLYEKSRTGPAR